MAGPLARVFTILNPLGSTFNSAFAAAFKIMSFNSEFIYTGHSDPLGLEDLESMLFSYEYGLGCGFEAVTYNVNS